MLDIAVADELRTVFYAAPPQGSSDLLREIVQYPHMLFGVSDGGAHTKFLTAGRYPTETLAQQVRDNQLDHLRGGPLAAVGSAGPARRLPRPRAAARRRPGRRRRLRPRAPRPSDPTEVVDDLPGGEWRRIQRASGYHAVFVNGVRTIADDCPDRAATPAACCATVTADRRGRPSLEDDALGCHSWGT